LKTKFLLFLAFSVFSIYANSNNLSDILTLSGSEDAEGVTQSDFDIAMLNALELRTKNKVKEKMTAYMSSQGYKEKTIEIKSSSVYVNAGNLKLAVVRLNIANTNQVHIYGIKGSELLRVACNRPTKESIPLSYGKCSEQIKETYGVDLSKGSK